GPVSLTGNNLITIPSGNTVYLRGTIKDATSGGLAPGGLTILGSGTMTLEGANTFTGGVNLSAASLVLTNSSALGSTTPHLTVQGGTIQAGLLTGNSGTPAAATAALTISNPIDFIGIGTNGATTTFAGPTTAGGGDLTFSGAATLTGAITFSVTSAG